MPRREHKASRAAKAIGYVFLIPVAGLPRFPVDIFYVSLGVSYAAAMIAIWLGRPEFLAAALARTPLLDYLTAQWFLDPLLVNVISACVAAALLFRSRPRSTDWVGRWSLTVRCLLPFVVLGVVLLVGDFVVKPAFGYDRPPDPLPEPPVLAWVEAVVPFLGKSAGDSAPSGFVMRQVAMFYLLLWVGWRSQNSRRTRLLVSIFGLLTLALVAFCRTYRSAHTLFDVMLALGVGTLQFWTILAFPMAFIRIRWMESKHLFCALGITYLAFGVSLFAVSQNGGFFIQVFAGGVILAFLALASPGMELPRDLRVR